MNYINSIKHGWCNLNFKATSGEEISIPASYLTDVPMELAHFCKEYKETQTATCWFDLEGRFATLCLTPYDAYLILEENESVFYNLKDSPDVIVNGLIEDIQEHIEDCISFNVDYDYYTDKDKESRRKALLDLKIILEKEVKI